MLVNGIQYGYLKSKMHTGICRGAMFSAERDRTCSSLEYIFTPCQEAAAE